MKKLFTTAIVCICLTTALQAQYNAHSKLSMGLFGGLNIPRLTDNSNNELSRDYKSRLGEAFGLTASFSLSSHFALQADVLYSSEGGRRDGIQAIDATAYNPAIPAGTYFYADFKNESILNYLEIPVMLKYSFPVSESLKFYAGLGPYAGYLINAKQKTSGSSIIYADRAKTIPLVPEAQSFDASVTETSSINRFNFGITVEIGIARELGPGELFLEGRGSDGLTNIQKYSQDGSSHSGYILIALGYSIGIY